MTHTDAGAGWQSYRASGSNGSPNSGTISGKPWELYGVSKKEWESTIVSYNTNQRNAMTLPAGVSGGEHSGARSDTFADHTTMGQLLTEFHSASAPAMQMLQQQLYTSGYYGHIKPTLINMGRMDARTVSALKKMWKEHNISGGAAGKSWEEFLFGSKQQYDSNGKSLYGSGGGGGGSGTQTSVNLSNHDQAQGYLQSAMTNLLGRNPTQDEVTRFQTALNGQEKAHPNVTTTDYSGRSSTSQSTGGVDGSVQATNYANGTPYLKEKDHYQIGSYMNALQSLLGGNTG